MILEKGNMWDVFGKTELFMITTNPIKRKDGAIVMGRGIAKEVKDRFPDLPLRFGNHFPNGYLLSGQPTGLIGRFDGQAIGWFMVKDHWAEEAKLSIITNSLEDLIEWADQWKRIDLNFPGIGNGKLSREDVLPLLEVLPDNVHVWEYA